MNADHFSENVVNLINKTTDKLISARYWKRSEESKNIVEASVLKDIARRFNAASDDVFVAVPLIESDRNSLTREAEGSNTPERKEMYQKGVDVYNTELKKIYKGEI